jgi:hypothetical protein
MGRVGPPGWLNSREKCLWGREMFVANFLQFYTFCHGAVLTLVMHFAMANAVFFCSNIKTKTIMLNSFFFVIVTSPCLSSFYLGDSRYLKIKL